MSRITLSDEVLSALAGVAEPVDVCDASGKVRGRFIPQPSEADQHLLDDARRHFDLAEAGRRSAAGGFLSGEEVQRRLRELEQRQ